MAARPREVVAQQVAVLHPDWPLVLIPIPFLLFQPPAQMRLLLARLLLPLVLAAVVVVAVAAVAVVVAALQRRLKALSLRQRVC